jgi:hypothetical protein
MASGPQKALFEDKYGLATLHYPLDLGSSRKGHWINFNISVPTKSTFQKATTTAGQDVGNLISSIGDFVLGVVDFIPGVGQSLNQQLKDLTYQYTVLPGTIRQVAAISLYTPDTISISQTANYNNMSLTAALGMVGQIAAAASGVGQVFDSGGAGLGNAFKGLATEAGIGALAGAGGNANDLLGAGLKTQGMALNPQMEVLFTGMEFRRFQFDFLFTPKSPQEAETVRGIIKSFKLHSSPEIDGGSAGRYFIVPSVFEIEIFHKGERNKNVHRFAAAALQTVVVDYAPQGWVTHEDGMPVQTRLTLQFQEMEIMTKEKIEDGF